MTKNGQNRATLRPAGYAALVERYALEVIPNWHKSMIAARGMHRVESTGGVVVETYPAKYWPGDKLGDQLEFALKYDGTNLAILASLFQVVARGDVLAYIQSKPNGKYARRVWFLYELLTGTTLPLADLTQGNYVNLLDPDENYGRQTQAGASSADHKQSVGRRSVLSDDPTHSHLACIRKSRPARAV